MTSQEIKELSEKKIRELNLNISTHLPQPDSFSSLEFRTAQEIATRIIILTYIVGVGHNAKRKVIREYLRKYNLYQSLSNAENSLLHKWILRKQDKIDSMWASESIEILGWSIGLWNEFDYLTLCNEDRQIEHLPMRKDPFDFISKAKLIDTRRIYIESDLLSRLHWISKRQTFGTLGKNTRDVYSERCKAINWIVDNRQNWDEVNTDT